MNKLTQQEKILKYLKEHGKLNSFHATYGLNCKQAPTRIKELRALGYEIQSLPSKGRSVDWVLNKSLVREVQEKPEWIFGADGIARLRVEPRQGVLL